MIVKFLSFFFMISAAIALIYIVRNLVLFLLSEKLAVRVLDNHYDMNPDSGSFYFPIFWYSYGNMARKHQSRYGRRKPLKEGEEHCLRITKNGKIVESKPLVDIFWIGFLLVFIFFSFLIGGTELD